MMENIVIETDYTEHNWQESALDNGREDDTSYGICSEASDEDTNPATFHLTSFNKRDIRLPATNGFDRYTLSGSTDVKWETENNTQTEQSENGTTNDKTTPDSGSTDGKCEANEETFVKKNNAGTEQRENGTPNSECVEKNLSNVFTSVKDKANEYMWLYSNARIDLLTNSMSDKETAKKKEITKQIATRWTPTRNGIFTWLCVLSTLLCITPVAALPRPPGGNLMNVSSSEYMNLERQHDMNDQGLNCRPQISAKTKPEDDFQQIECETSTCTSVSRIIFEKTGVHSTTEWTPVFEVYNKSYYQPLDTNSEYTLTNRALFSAFSNKHLLYIQPLRLDDRGKWKCAAFDANNISYSSMSTFEVDFIYVTPKNGNINIRRQQTEIVTGQATEFTCEVYGVFPKPNVMWVVNGIKNFSGISSKRKRGDKLWSVINKVVLTFDTKGVHNVTCNIITDNRNPWIQQQITIDVKEAALILIPNKERIVLLQQESMMSLECIGTGYKPHIHWMKDDEDILDSDSRFELKRDCNESTCLGYIKAHNVDSAVWCVQGNAYTGVYACVISLEDPYNSIKMSPSFNVIMHDPAMCSKLSKNYIGHFGLIIVISIALAIVAMFAVQLCIVIQQKKRQATRNHSHETGQGQERLNREYNYDNEFKCDSPF